MPTTVHLPGGVKVVHEAYGSKKGEMSKTHRGHDYTDNHNPNRKRKTTRRSHNRRDNDTMMY